jgi:SAM-dependent methyltransferase
MFARLDYSDKLSLHAALLHNPVRKLISFLNDSSNYSADRKDEFFKHIPLNIGYEALLKTGKKIIWQKKEIKNIRFFYNQYVVGFVNDINYKKPAINEFHIKSNEDGSINYAVVTLQQEIVLEKITKSELQAHFQDEYKEFFNTIQQNNISPSFFDKILEITSKRKHTLEVNRVGTPICLYIHYANGEKTTLSIEKKSENKLQTILAQLGLTSYNTFNRNSFTALDWKQGIGKHYGVNQTRDYHQKDERLLLELEIQLEEKESTTIVDLGCGDGRFLKKAEEKFSSKHDYIGIDFCGSNIENAKKEYKGKITFVEGDMLNVFKLLENNQTDKNKPIMFISLGSLTRLVISDGFFAARVLKELVKDPRTVGLLVEGLTEPLITRYMAKRIGFELRKSEAHFYSFGKMSEEQILKNKLKKMEKFKLDLSLSPIPEKWLEHKQIQPALPSKSSQNVLSIDISYCTLTPQLTESILRVSEKSNVHWIFKSNDPREVTDFRKIFVKHYPLIQVIDTETVENDAYLIGPKDFIDSLCCGRLINIKQGELLILFLLGNKNENSKQIMHAKLRELSWLIPEGKKLINIENAEAFERFVKIMNLMHEDRDNLAYKLAGFSLPQQSNLLLATIMTIAFDNNISFSPSMLSLNTKQALPNLSYCKTARLEERKTEEKKMITTLPYSMTQLKKINVGTSLLFIDPEKITFEKEGKIGHSKGNWVKVSGHPKMFFTKCDSVFEQTDLSCSSADFSGEDDIDKAKNQGTVFIEALASKVYEIYLEGGTPFTAISFTYQPEIKEKYPTILSAEVEPQDWLQYSSNLAKVCRILEHLITNEFIGDPDPILQNFVGEKFGLRRINFERAFKRKGEFSIELLNPFKLIEKLYATKDKKDENIKLISHQFYEVIYHNYEKCVETILNTLLKKKIIISDLKHLQLRKNTIKLFDRYFTKKNYQFIENFLEDNERKFLFFLKNLTLPSSHFISQIFGEKLRLLQRTPWVSPTFFQAKEKNILSENPGATLPATRAVPGKGNF